MMKMLMYKVIKPKSQRKHLQVCIEAGIQPHQETTNKKRDQFVNPVNRKIKKRTTNHTNNLNSTFNKLTVTPRDVIYASAFLSQQPKHLHYVRTNQKRDTEIPLSRKVGSTRNRTRRRLCTSCAHVVRDFRDCSKEDLNSALQTQSHVCGIFNRSQLSSTFLKAASIAIAATTISACNTEQPTPVVETVTQSLNEIEFEEPTMGIVFTPLPDTLPIPLPDTLKGNEYSRE